MGTDAGIVTFFAGDFSTYVFVFSSEDPKVPRAGLTRVVERASSLNKRKTFGHEHPQKYKSDPDLKLSRTPNCNSEGTS